MPIVSEAQRGAMYAAKAGKSTLGIPQSVGAEFVKAGPASSHLPARVKHPQGNEAPITYGERIRDIGGHFSMDDKTRGL